MRQFGWSVGHPTHIEDFCSGAFLAPESVLRNLSFAGCALLLRLAFESNVTLELREREFRYRPAAWR
jgi:hypothetical protein